MRCFTLLTLLTVLLSMRPATAQIPDFIKRTAKEAGQFDPTKEADSAPQNPAPAPPAPADPLASRMAAWVQQPATDGTKVKLYYAHPDYRAAGSAKLPGLIVVQEWWGLNDDIQQRTRDLAHKGFYAVAVDLYDGQVTTDPKEAAAFKGKLTDDGALLRLKAGLDFLQAQATAGIVDAQHIGVVGWCMGGEQALKLAVTDPRIKATAIFYGPLITDKDKLAHLQGPVLGIFGNTDTHPSPTDVNAFEEALKADGIAVTIYRYEGVGHAFASPSAKALGMYHEKEGADAFGKLYEWLAANLQNGK